MRRWLPWAALVVVVVVALGVGASGSGSGTSAAARSSRLAKEVRCPTCRGLSAAESDAKAAQAVRAEIRSRVAAGQSDAEIRAYLASRYGDDILLRPEGSGMTALVWALPVVVLVCGAAGLAVAFRRWKVRGP
ncbi:MAG: cytochrome c-type biosis protein CcmH [Actinomycetota bacterium]|nr:cytochrome c-type biosis protein CcmH [Actinomycetota bacterium]